MASLKLQVCSDLPPSELELGSMGTSVKGFDTPRSFELSRQVMTSSHGGSSWSLGTSANTAEKEFLYSGFAR